MDRLVITETEERCRYEARAFYRGRILSQVFYRDEHLGWPHDYKQRARAAVQQAAAALNPKT